MSTSFIFNPAHKTLPVSNLFMTRQPILDRNESLVGYRLLFRNAPVDPLHIISDLSETAAVIAHFFELGIEEVIDDALGFIKVDAAVLMNEVVNTLPPDRMVLEIVKTIEVTPELLARMTELTKAGFRFAIDDVSGNLGEIQKLLPLIDIIKFDQSDMPLSVLKPLAAQIKLTGKKLLAKKVETIEQFKRCLDLGFDYFQGYYFAIPRIVPGKTLSPSHISAMQLMALITTDADSAEIELGLKRDVTIGLNLLRLVNTPAVGNHRIDSFKQALMILGRNQLQRWLQIMLYAESPTEAERRKPLMMLALTRGKLMELIAHKHRAGNSSIADTAFMVGIMSLMDTLFSLPMTQVLQGTAVLDEVVDALLYRKGYYGELLTLVENAELIEDAGMLMKEIENFRLTSEEFYLLQLAAFEWSDNISHIVE